MKRNVVACAYTIVAVTLLSGCQEVVDPAKVMDPSGLRINPEAIVYTESIRDIDWNISESHPCNPGETIAVNGTSHWVIHTSFDNQGGFHYKVNIVSKGNGVGSPSAKVYKINEHFREAENAPGNFTTYIIYETMRLKVDGPTPADDYYKTTVHKIVVDGQGVQTIGIDNESNSCT